MKLCFTASSGGHFEELSCLQSIAQMHETFVVTEGSDLQPDTGPDWAARTYYVPQINRREPLFPLHFIRLFFTSWCIMRREKPDCVISTGALATYPVCLIARLMKKKIIYIESFARVDNPSLTGRMMAPLANLFIVQWEEMLQFYPNAVYTGGIF